METKDIIDQTNEIINGIVSGQTSPFANITRDIDTQRQLRLKAMEIAPKLLQCKLLSVIIDKIDVANDKVELAKAYNRMSENMDILLNDDGDEVEELIDID